MRSAIAVPALGLWAAFAFAQAPDVKENRRPDTAGGVSALAPGISPIEALRPLPPATLRSSFVEARPQQTAGANRNVIERAIRALGSRIFPSKGNTQATPPRTGFGLIGGRFAAPGLGAAAEHSPETR